MSFDRCIRQLNCHKQDIGHFQPPPEGALCPSAIDSHLSSPSLSSSSWQPLVSFLCLESGLFQTVIKWNHLAFNLLSHLLLSRSRILLRFNMLLGTSYFFIILYLFLAVLGLCCCTRAFPSWQAGATL